MTGDLGKDPYRVLQVGKDASQEDLRKAFRRLAREHHPDANPGDPKAEEHFKQVQRAYEVLSDPGKRERYDRSQAAPRGGGRRRTRPQAGGGAHQGGTVHASNLSDFLSKLNDLSAEGGKTSRAWELRGEEVARLAKVLGVDITRLSKLLGDRIRAGTKVSFEQGWTHGSAKMGEDAPGGRTEKPGKPPKPPKPPRTEKPDS